MKLRRLLPFAAFSLLNLGCGFIKVNGKPLEAPGSAKSGESAGAKSEGGTAKGEKAKDATGFEAADNTTVDVTLEKTRQENPVMQRMSVNAQLYPNKAGFKCGFSDYVSTAPNALVTIGAGAENLTIKARSNITGLLLSKDGKFFCATDDNLRSIGDRVSLKPTGLEAGTYELRVLLGRQSKKPVDVVLAFYDHTRGVTYNDSVIDKKLDESPKKPLFVAGDTWSGDGYRQGDRRCKGTYGPMPQAIFHSDQPIGDLRFMPLWGPKPFELRIQPLAGDNKPAKNAGWCSRDGGSLGANNLDGQVAIHVGNREGSDSRPFGYVVLGKETVVDPFRMSPVPRPKKLAITQRKLSNHFPFLYAYLEGGRGFKFSIPNLRKGADTDKVRQRLFLDTPADLFVAAKYDLDKNSARSRGADDFPKKGETLLVASAQSRSKYLTVYRADGAEYSVLEKALVHPGSYSVPIRTQQKFSATTAIRFAGPEDKPLTDAMYAEQTKYKKCFERMTASADRQIDAINNTRLHWTTFNKRRKAQIWDAAEAAAERGCGKARLKAFQEKTKKNVAAARQQRIDDRLGKIAERLAGL